MPRKQEQTPKKKTKEKSPKKSEDPEMDTASINELLQNAIDQANAKAEQKLDHDERLTAALRDEITKKHQEEMIELQDAFVKVLIVDDFHKGLFLVSEHGDPRRAPFTTSRLHEVGLDVTFGPLNVGVVGFLSGPDGSDPPAGQPGRIEAPNGRTHPRRQLL